MNDSTNDLMTRAYIVRVDSPQPSELPRACVTIFARIWVARRGTYPRRKPGHDRPVILFIKLILISNLPHSGLSVDSTFVDS